MAFNVIRAWQKIFGRHARGDYLLLSGAPSDTLARLNWYLSDCTVPVFSGVPPLAPHGQGLAVELSTPHLRHREDRPAGRPHTVLNASLAHSMRAAVRRPARVTLVSPTLYSSADTLGYLRLRRSFSDRVPVDQGWPLERLASGLSDAWAVLAATGPSADGFDWASCRGADVRIICNSAVRNSAVLEGLQPNVLCFGDPVFHFGPSQYASAFRADLVRACEGLPDLVLVVPEHFRELLVCHLPHLDKRIYGLTLGSVPRAAPQKAQAAVTRRTGNVLTQNMLPIALQFEPKRLSLIGCDGRKKEENYFWKHSKAGQYSDSLMRSVFDAHPSFFRDVIYADYYDRHCDELRGYIELFETQGTTVDTLTPSFIPVLSERLTRP